MACKKSTNDRNTYATGWSLYGMRYTFVPYCDSIKGITQRSIGNYCIRDTVSIVTDTIGIIEPHGFGMVVYNRWISIVHNDRLRGYVLRSWHGTEKAEAVSRRIFNPGRGGSINRIYLGRSGAG